MAEKKGYVYILTHPSFQESWVKIGCTKRDVEKRVKELNNTFIPINFAIYATVKTAKYRDLEKLLHEAYSEHSAGKEIFSIAPESVMQTIEKMRHFLEDDFEIYNPPKKVGSQNTEKSIYGIDLFALGLRNGDRIKFVPANIQISVLDANNVVYNNHVFFIDDFICKNMPKAQKKELKEGSSVLKYFKKGNTRFESLVKRMQKQLKDMEEK